jgi:hypothetical protein
MRPINDNSEGDLEQWIHHELRRLPDCAAPGDLINRVLDQVRRRQALPWWRQSLWFWPAPVRWLVLTLLGSLSVAVVGVGTGLWSPFELPALPLQDWAASLQQMWGGYQFLPKALSGWWSVQGGSTWLVGTGLFCALVYMLVVGIGSIFLQMTGPAQPSQTTRNA